MRSVKLVLLISMTLMFSVSASAATGASKYKPYRAPCVERESVFEFVNKPAIESLGNDKYEITFSVKGACDVTVGLVDKKGVIVRHLASGVLGSNAPKPFRKNALSQKIYWDGKDDLDVYVKEPEALRLRVSLGLNPKFDKLLGCTHPKSLPGRVWGITADKDGVYVFVLGMGRGHITVRKFDHKAEYLATLWPPPANLPPSKLGGMGYVEYEPGKRAVQAPVIHAGMWRESQWMPIGVASKFGLFTSRPTVANGRIYFTNSGFPGAIPGPPKFRMKMYYINTDGSTEYEGLAGRLWQNCEAGTRVNALASSPDGKNLYMVGLGAPAKRSRKGKGKSGGIPVLLSGATRGKEQAKVLVGNMKKSGVDNRSFSYAVDVACDAKGRVYVADMSNNRVQVFAPDGGFLKSIKMDRPTIVQVHQKSGVIYVAQMERVKGKSTTLLTRFSAFPALKQTAQWKIGAIDTMALDSWSSKPRLWISSEAFRFESYGRTESFTGKGLRVFEDRGKEIKLVNDFDQEAQKATGENYTGRWDGGMYHNIECDPVREKVYYKKLSVFDLKTGKFSGWFGGKTPSDITRCSFPVKHNVGNLGDIAFDKHGYMHGHLNEGFDCKKVIVRMDPDRMIKDGGYAEVPYNYGVMKTGRNGRAWAGVVPGVATESETFSYGLGVNMQGDFSVGLRVLYSPKMETKSFEEKSSDQKARQSSGFFFGPNLKYAEWQRQLQDVEKLGEKLFFVKRRPGLPLTGSVIMTHDRSGEVREHPAVVPGSRSNGVQMDEEGNLYFTNSRFVLRGKEPFLAGQGGNFGGKPISRKNTLPFVGAYIKTPGKGAKFVMKKAMIPAEELPKRPAELATPPGGSNGAFKGDKTFVWAENAKWLYAGASPIVADHCDCPQMRVWLDWYKRSFVPEAYRHSIGILDSNGNLIMHVGRYGNFDSGAGKKSKIPLGGDGIATTMVRYVSGTDNYLCIMDWGQRLIVAKLGYHKQEFASIKVKN